MKRIFILIMAIVPIGAFAAAPSTSCPAGYVTVVEEYMEIADSTCPTGYTSAVPADGYTVGHVLSAISIYSSPTVTYPAGNEGDGSAANTPNGTTTII